MTQDDKNRTPAPDPLTWIPRGLNYLHTQWLRRTYPFAFMGSKVSIHYRSSINRMTAHRIRLGNYVLIEKDAHLGVGCPPHEKGDPVLVIDDCAVVHWRSQIGAKNLIHIERDVTIAQDVLITDHGHAYENVDIPVLREEFTQGGIIRIGEGSWIGHGAAIICSKGELILGRHCIVNANAVVTRSAPPYSVLSGNPARVTRQYDPEKKIWVMGQVHSAHGVVQTI